MPASPARAYFHAATMGSEYGICGVPAQHAYALLPGRAADVLRELLRQDSKGWSACEVCIDFLKRVPHWRDYK